MTAAARARLLDVARGKGAGPLASCFLVEGRKAVGDALSRAAVRVREVWLADHLPPDALDDLARAAAGRRVPVGIASGRDLERASDVVAPQGAIALVDDPARDVADLLALDAGDAPILLLDHVQDPGNVGAILRVAAAFCAGGVLLTADCAHPMGSKALRASAGTALVVPFARGAAADLVAALAAARRPIWLLDSSGQCLWDRTSRPRGLVLAVGSEGSGAGAEVSAAAAARVAIPISPAVESLNAAVATGVAAAHLFRLPVAASQEPSPVRTAGARTPRHR